MATFAGVRLGPGTLYGALSRLDEDGPVERSRLTGGGGPTASPTLGGGPWNTGSAG